MTNIRLVEAVGDVEAVVVGVGSGSRVEPPGDAVPANLLDALSRSGATGAIDEVRLITPADPASPLLLAVGLGDPAPDTPARHQALRRAAGTAVRALAGNSRVALVLPGGDAGAIRALAEGALLGAYTFTAYRSVPAPGHRPPVDQVQLVVPDPADPAVTAAVARATAVAEAVALARDLVNTPPADLPPARFAALAAARAARAGIAVEDLDHEALRGGGFGGIAGVGQGSAHPPHLLHLSYRGGERARTRVALAGKGVTFDSGGISLKAASGMAEMKMDMAGAAAVLAATLAAARLRLAVDIEAWLPLAENMPGGRAIRPSDVLTMWDGRRVEVIDTDCEGRLMLADALARASADRPDLLLDLATLTSAQMVALGRRMAGVMANDDALRNQVVAAADRAGEPCWGMPLPADLRPELDSTIADIVNCGPREGGMLLAGLFLQEFVGPEVRWAHLDIAGPAYNTGEPYGYTPRGATGSGVRTLVQLLCDLDGR